MTFLNDKQCWPVKKGNGARKLKRCAMISGVFSSVLQCVGFPGFWEPFWHAPLYVFVISLSAIFLGVPGGNDHVSAFGGWSRLDTPGSTSGYVASLLYGSVSPVLRWTAS